MLKVGPIIIDLESWGQYLRETNFDPREGANQLIQYCKQLSISDITQLAKHFMLTAPKNSNAIESNSVHNTVEKKNLCSTQSIVIAITVAVLAVAFAYLYMQS